MKNSTGEVLVGKDLEIMKNVRKRNIKRFFKSSWIYIILLLLAIVFMFPFIVMICTSFLPDSESTGYPPRLFSQQGIIYLGAYRRILQNSDYLNYIKNSLGVGLLSAVGIPFFSSLCAYGFAKLEFKGKNLVFGIMLSTMMIPAITTQIPLYRVYVALNWNNTLLPLWLPAWFGGGATNIFLMTQFMRGIPKDLNNAAMIDGASSFRIFISMMIPLCIPVIVYVMVNSFIGSWNDFMTPLLFLGSNKSMWTLSLGIYKDYGVMDIAANIRPNIMMASGIIMMLPCIVLFFCLQKFLIEGVTVTGLKG